MRASWEIDETTIIKWRKLYEENKDNDLVISRKKRNLQKNEVELSKSAIWSAIVGCLVTTQQRSGPGSKTSIFLESNSLVLSFKRLKKSIPTLLSIESELKRFGLRYSKRISQHIHQIYINLEAENEWPILIGHLENLVSRTSKKKEQIVVRYLQSYLYPGIGPKQSRNMIQWLGLSKYEVPLDSRVLKKLQQLDSNLVPTSIGLGDEIVYEFVQSGLQKVAKELGIYPCILDACIFSSFDKKTK